MVATGPVGGATTGTLRAQAAAIENRIAADGSTLDANSLAYLAEQRVYAADLGAERRTSTRVARIARTVARDQTIVRNDAIAAYTNAGNSSPLGLFLDGEPDEIATTAEYTRFADNAITTSIDALRGDEVALRAGLASEHAEVALVATSLAATEDARDSAISALDAERSTLSSVNGELATLVEQEEIARERAAAEAAARAAAASAAAAAAAATSATPTSATAAAGPPQVVAAAPAAAAGAPPTSLSGDFAAIRRCESSDDYALDSGNGYYGAYQFSLSTWENLGGSGLPNAAPASSQDAAAYKLYQSSGWASWPECAAIAGL
jgi:hypothetical protein